MTEVETAALRQITQHTPTRRVIIVFFGPSTVELPRTLLRRCCRYDDRAVFFFCNTSLRVHAPECSTRPQPHVTHTAPTTRTRSSARNSKSTTSADGENKEGSAKKKNWDEMSHEEQVIDGKARAQASAASISARLAASFGRRASGRTTPKRIPPFRSRDPGPCQ